MVLAFSVRAKKVDLKKRSVSLSFNFDTMPALFGRTDEVLPGGVSCLCPSDYLRNAPFR